MLVELVLLKGRAFPNKAHVLIFSRDHMYVCVMPCGGREYHLNFFGATAIGATFPVFYFCVKDARLESGQDDRQHSIMFVAAPARPIAQKHRISNYISG